MDGRRTYRGMLVFMLVFLAFVAAACAPKASEPTEALNVEPQVVGADSAGEERAATGVEPADAGGAVVEGAEGAGPLPAVTSAPRSAAVEVAPAAEADFAAAPESEVGGIGGGPEEGIMLPPADNPVIPPDQQFIGPLQAGEIDDNQDFAEYLQYRTDFHKFLGYPVTEVDISERHIIQVTTEGGLPVLGAEVLIYDGQSLVTALRTTATGRAYFFPLAYPAFADAQSYAVTVQKGRVSEAFTLIRGSRDATWPVMLGVRPARPPVKLDVLFLIDATGSMGDEIDELKNNILSISAQIEALPSNPDVRFGLVHYRDRGDAYVVRRADFTGNVQAFQRDLMDVQAAGGGDDPESLNEALYNAVERMSWRVDDTVSLIFLVADAPPHLDYPQDYSYADAMMIAAERGIKIFPIGSRLDGADAYQKQAEYIFRQLAQFTGGHFIFLTYEDTPQSSGEPGTEYSVPEGSYSVQDLDALVVRLVQDELETLMGGQQ